MAKQGMYVDTVPHGREDGPVIEMMKNRVPNT
jgi:hypothetical protein